MLEEATAIRAPGYSGKVTALVSAVEALVPANELTADNKLRLDLLGEARFSFAVVQPAAPTIVTDYS